MKLAATRAMGLAILMAILLQPAFAWGQLRTHSGAVKSGTEHPKALERRVFQLTNEARRKNGLPPLDPDSGLTDRARTQADTMIQDHTISQTSRDREKKIKQYDQEEPARIGLAGKPGENIHMGYKDDYSDVETAARLIVNGLMGSPPQRSNILNPAYTRMGVGVSIKGKESYIIQEFSQK